mgnify:FL=1
MLIGYPSSKVRDFLSKETELIFSDGNKVLKLNDIKKINPEIIVSYKCQYLLTKDIVTEYKNKLINLHGSMLPHNRGAHPNVWSFLENTPKGGTIHYIDEGIDTGDILVQKEIKVSEDDTLKSTYWKIRTLLENLLINNWSDIVNNKIKPQKQDKNSGSLHYKQDLDKVRNLFRNNWNTKVNEVNYENN